MIGRSGLVEQIDARILLAASNLVWSRQAVLDPGELPFNLQVLALKQLPIAGCGPNSKAERSLDVE
jgi:hypothetical protein